MKIRIIAMVIACIGILAAHAAAPARVTTPYGQKIFISGINVAWKAFGGDVGKYPVDTAWFAKMLQGVADSGGNCVRWWLFTDCSNDPQFDRTTGLVKGLGESTVSNIRKVLDMGYARGVSIDLCLLSFDMMKTGKTGVDIDANKRILQTDAGRKAFIDNAVVPLVKAIGRHPAISNWEIFNEPEGMVQSIAGDWGSMATGISIVDVQKMVNQAAGAIHRAVPGVPVSNGCWSFIAGSNTVTGDRNYYSDTELKNAGGDPDGTLDFYMVHYYEWAKTERSPFSHPASYWGLDKALVIGEFPAKGLSADVGAMTPVQCWNYLMNNGYAGAMGWTYTAHDGFGGLPEAGQGMRALKTSAPLEVTLDFPPAAVDDWYADTANKLRTVAAPGVLANDREPTAGQKLTATVLLKPAHGSLRLEQDGSFSYTPNAGWSGTDAFVYLAIGGNSAADTATATIRVLDPVKSTFFAPPKAADWQTYAAWGKVSVEDLPAAMGINHAQWGGPAVWLVGGGTSVTVTSVQYTVSMLVRNDPASPWGACKFHLTTKTAVGAYGPTDTTTDIVTLAPQPAGADGYVEYRGTFTPKTAGAYLPAVEFIWNDTDGNGPNSSHQSALRDLEICPSTDFVTIRMKSTVHEPHAAISRSFSGRTMTITSPGDNIEAIITDLRGRQIACITKRNTLQWELPRVSGAVVVTVRTGMRVERFVMVSGGAHRLFN
jgi:hypothetical protein